MDLKDYAALVAGVAGFAGLGVSLVTLLMKTGENRRTIRSQLTDVLARLNTVNAESRKFRIETGTSNLSPDQRGMFSFYNDQRSFLVGQAIYLIEQVPKHVTHSELAVVARAVGSTGDHETACEYFKRCMECSPSDLIKGMHCRGFAGYLFDQGQVQMGREYFQDSLKLILGTSDPRRFDRVETLTRWSIAEKSSGFSLESKELLDKATREVSLIQTENVRRRGFQVVQDANFAAQPPLIVNDGI
jgi:tetratricopeptide (TPR) repeat protein